MKPVNPEEEEQAKFECFLESRVQHPENDSGRGPESRLPDELRGLNWGALLLNFVWGLAMRVPYTWFCVIPIFGTLFPFVMWVRGNEWAWKFRRWESVEHFRRVQEHWALAGLILIVASIIIGILISSWTERMMDRMLAV